MPDSFIMRWIAATVPGFAAGGVLWATLAAVTGFLNNPLGPLDWLIPLLAMAVAGLMSGAGQQQFLQRVSGVRIPHWWMASPVGYATGLLTAGVMASVLSAQRLVMSFAITGASVSIAPYTLTGDPYWAERLVGGSIFFLYFSCIFAFAVAAAGGFITGTIQATVLRHRLRAYAMWPFYSMVILGGSAVASVIISWLFGTVCGGPPSLQLWYVDALLGLMVWPALGLAIALLSAPLMASMLREPYEPGMLL